MIYNSFMGASAVLPEPIPTAVGTSPSRTLSGLKTPTSSQLSWDSTSAADPQVTTTTVTALLQLKAPKNTAAGNYAGLLTLTLI